MSVREVSVEEIKCLHTSAKLTRIEKQRLVLSELLYKARESVDQPVGISMRNLQKHFLPLYGYKEWDTRNAFSG
jgi:hypothetical protein